MGSAFSVRGVLILSTLLLVHFAQGSPRTLFQGLQSRTRVAGGSLSQQEQLKLFKLLVKLAEDLYAESGSLETAVSQLRTAFLLCPECRYDDFGGAKFREAFSIDMLGDRLYLSDDIFGAIQQQRQTTGSKPKLLWAGCHPYTLRYEYLLRGVEILSMDPNPAVSVYGSSRRHEVDILQNVGKHAPPATFDYAIVNGVIGWGIDTPAQVEEFVKAMHAALRPGGLLIVGFNRHMTHCCAFAPYFEPATLGALPHRKDFEGQWQHSFEIYARSAT